MSDFPEDKDVQVLRDLIQLCENFKIGHIKMGAVEFAFSAEKMRRELTSDEISRLKQRQIQADLDTKYAHTGVVPQFPDFREKP